MPSTVPVSSRVRCAKKKTEILTKTGETKAANRTERGLKLETKCLAGGIIEHRLAAWYLRLLEMPRAGMSEDPGTAWPRVNELAFALACARD